MHAFIGQRRCAVRHRGNVSVALIAGAVAALVGALVWAGIGYGTGYEVGYVAWGIGFLVGVAMLAVGKGGNAGLGISAAGLAAGGIIVGKLLMVAWLAQSSDVIDEVLSVPETRLSSLHIHMVENKEFEPDLLAAIDAAGEDGEMSPDMEAKYQAAILERMERTSEEEFRTMAAGLVSQVMSTRSYSDRLKDTLSPYDILWFGLAVFTAYRIASGASGAEA